MTALTIRLPRSPEHGANRERTRADRDGCAPCVVCGRAVSLGRPFWSVHLHGGGDLLLRPGVDAAMAGLDPADDLGGHPIGPDCRRQHPALHPFTVRVRPG